MLSTAAEVGAVVWGNAHGLSPQAPCGLPRARLAEVQHAEKRPHLTALLHMYCLCECREPVITEDVSTSPLLNEWVHIILLTQVHSCFWTWILLWELLLHIPYLSFTCPWCSLLASPFESLVLEVPLPTSASIQIPAPCSAAVESSPSFPFQLEVLYVLFHPKPPFENTLVDNDLFFLRDLWQCILGVFNFPQQLPHNMSWFWLG